MTHGAMPSAGRRELALHHPLYRRPRHLPDWPYNLFAMVLCKNRIEAEAHVAAIASLLRSARRAHEVLYSSRILKKTGLRIAG